MSLSAAIIVRDEADHLDACLTSLRGLVDEIVVVDTGSSDRSVAVAERHGAVVGRAPWRDDFSAPRNLSLELASGDGEWRIPILAHRVVAEHERAGHRPSRAFARSRSTPGNLAAARTGQGARRPGPRGRRLPCLGL